MPVETQITNRNTIAAGFLSVRARWLNARCRYTVVQMLASAITIKPAMDPTIIDLKIPLMAKP